MEGAEGVQPPARKRKAIRGEPERGRCPTARDLSVQPPGVRKCAQDTRPTEACSPPTHKNTGRLAARV